jgi:hypothetical protein
MPLHVDSREKRERQMVTTVQDAPGGRLIVDAPLLCDGCRRVIGGTAARPWALRCRFCKTETSRGQTDPVRLAA